MRFYWYGKEESPKQHDRNWGDICTPYILEPLLGYHPLRSHRNATGKLLTVGSIMHRLRGQDVVWGAGIISPTHFPNPIPPGVVFHAVRGPLTRKVLKTAGADVPVVYGDPALFISHLVPRAEQKVTHELGVIPHYNDMEGVVAHVGGRADIKVINICGGFQEVIDQVCSCERILSSTLHGLILGDCYAKQAAWWRINGGSKLVGRDFKFKDYLLGTNRSPTSTDTFGSVPERADIEWLPPPDIDLGKLFDACPCNETGIDISAFQGGSS